MVNTVQKNVDVSSDEEISVYIREGETGDGIKNNSKTNKDNNNLRDGVKNKPQVKSKPPKDKKLKKGKGESKATKKDKDVDQMIQFNVGSMQQKVDDVVDQILSATKVKTRKEQDAKRKKEKRKEKRGPRLSGVKTELQQKYNLGNQEYLLVTV